MNRVEQVVNVTESDFNNTNNTGMLNDNEAVALLSHTSLPLLSFPPPFLSPPLHHLSHPPFLPPSPLSSPPFSNILTGVLNLQLNKTVFLNEYQRSYKCESVSLKLSGKFNSTNATINSTVVLEELQVQAFDFRRNNTFGNGRHQLEWTLSLTF